LLSFKASCISLNISFNAIGLAYDCNDSFKQNSNEETTHNNIFFTFSLLILVNFSAAFLPSHATAPVLAANPAAAAVAAAVALSKPPS